jgi:LmbE family N-acetylglucosaminyl deacetylase
MNIRSYLIVIALICVCSAAIAADKEPDAKPIETWKGKTVLIFTPHPDDDTFGCGGIMKILADNGNNVQVVIYTNDDKGSRDLEMTSERLARIRKAEEERACEILGIPKENLTWFGYEDGNLEYAEPKRLRGEVARQMKMHRPDAVFTIDPGSKNERWHKTDHRMAAFITQDAFIASEWHLYYPHHLLVEKLKPYHVPLVYYYYSEDPNVTIDITAVFDDKVKAAAAHVSQFEPSIDKYTPEMGKETFAGITAWARSMSEEDGKMVERFRRVEWP